MSDVVPLFEGAVPLHQPNENLIAVLERCLAEAQRGEIDGIGIAISRPNDRLHYCFNVDRSGSIWRVWAAADILKSKLARECDETPFMEANPT